MKYQKNLITVLCIMLQLYIHAQDVQWIIKPLVDVEFEVDRDVEWKNLIQIKKDKRVGLVNSKNQIIVPVEYQWVHVTHNDRLINAAVIGGGNEYFTGNGKKISKEKYQQLFEKIKQEKSKTYADKSLDNLETLKQLGSNLTIDYGVDGLSKLNSVFDVVSPEGDTLAKTTTMYGDIIFSDQFVVVKDKRNFEEMLVDIFSGEVISSVRDLKLVENKNGFLMVPGKEDNKILHAEGRLIGSYKAAALDSDYNYAIIDEGASKYLLNLNTNQKVGPTVEQLIHLDKGDFYLFVKDHSFSFYNVKEQKMMESSHAYFKYSPEFGAEVIIESDGLKGLFNLERNELVIPSVYNKIKFMAANLVLCEEIQESQTGTIQVLFDINGKELYRGSNEKVYAFKKGFIVTKADKSKGLYSLNGQLIQRFDASTKISFQAGANYIAIKKGDKTQITHIDFLNKKQAVVFDAITKTIKFRESATENWYIAQLDDLLGIIDQNGKMVLPFEYTKFDFKRFNGTIILVQKDNKWGIIEHP